MDEKAKEEKRQQKDYRRHCRVWRFAHLFKPVVKHMFKLEADTCPEIDGSYLVLANHSTNLDPVLVGLSFPRQMYFVASEHVYRQGFVSKLLKWTFEPIAKMKGSSDALTVMKAIRYLRSGKNVAIFAEGNRTFNGRTELSLITEATGKLVKAAASNLVTYRLEGGYFAQPRWGFTIRKGKVYGRIVNIYKKEDLKQMTPAQITELIRADIDENAYSRQEKEHIRYKGKRIAEGLECAVSVCPKCRKIVDHVTKKSTITCPSCHSTTTLDDYGYFPEDFPVHTVEQWDNFQEEFYANLCSSSDTATPLFSDRDILASTITQDHEQTSLGQGTLTVFTDRFEFTPEKNVPKSSSSATAASPTSMEKTVIHFSDVPDMSIYAKTGLVFTGKDGIHYEFTADRIINVRKHLSVWNNSKKSKS